MSTDRLLSAAGMALAAGRTPDWLPPVPWGPPKVKRPGSPNHRAEAAAVALLAHQPPDPLADAAIEQCIDRLEQQRCDGHQTLGGTTELLTDSHGPHWIRLMGVMHTAQRLAVPVNGNQAARLRYLGDLIEDWWAGDIWLGEQILVPYGPLRGQEVGLGARFATGRDLVRDVAHATIGREVRMGALGVMGRPLPRLPNGKPVGKAWWANATREPGTWGAHLVRELQRAGAFQGLEPRKPTLPCRYEVERDATGHTCRTPDGPLQAGDPVELRVDYRTGETTLRRVEGV